MLRRINKDVIQKGLDGEESQPKQKTAAPVITYEKPEAWCTIDEFPPLLDVFEMDNFMDSQFVEKMLTLYRPRETDKVGYVYILQRQTDVDRQATGEISHILLHKIGMTYKEPEVRVNQQRRANKEQYHILAHFRSSYHKYFEYACHRYFQDRRVVKCDSKDGGTEWFMADPTQLLPGIQKIRKALYYMYNDTQGWKPKQQPC